MGTNDAREQLDVCKDEYTKLEQQAVKMAAVIMEADAMVSRGTVNAVQMHELLDPSSAEAVLRKRDAKKWAEGFDAGERDVMQHWPEHGEGIDECIQNPYLDEEE